MMTKEKSKVLNQMMSRVRPSAIALAGGIMAITPQAAYPALFTKSVLKGWREWRKPLI